MPYYRISIVGAAIRSWFEAFHPTMVDARIAAAQAVVAIAFHTVPALGEMTALCNIVEVDGREEGAFVVSIEVSNSICKT
ncbi:hypothetical protein QP166_13705 [Sphingomonas sp. LR60]|uniref:hypothetical protein n=1 Tax=Sphingomonas sp. LR60 TaxID=3050233 RepID=UPI002FE3FD77